MSYDSITSNYKKWAASDDNADWQLVETLEISNPAFTTQYWCDAGANLIADLEGGGGSRTFIAIPFTMDYPSMKITTEQTLQVEVDALDGQLYAELKAMTPAERLVPIEIVHRTYLDGDTSGPVFLPPPTFKTTKVIVGHLSLSLTATSTMLPNRRAGTVYGLEQFPTLRYA